MSEDKSIKLIKAVKELNIGMGTIVDFLATKGYKVEKQPMAKLDNDMYTTLLKEFAVDKIIKEEAKQISIGKIRKEDIPRSLTLKNLLKTIVQEILRTRRY
jgi:translation initiation factor IF-2